MGHPISKRFLMGLVILAGSLFLAVPSVLAGGWAVITLDQLPGQVTAGQSISIGFMVRQHGVTPMASLTPQITMVHKDTGKSLTISAKADGQVGHYAAALTFPQPGVWSWSIAAFTIEQPMPALTVVAAEPVAEEEPASPDSWPLLMGVMGLVGATGTSLLWWRKRAWWSSTLVLAALIVSVVGFGMAANRPIKAEAEPVPIQVGLGRELFVSKGCIVCHKHDEVREQANISLEVGPNLTRYPTTAEYLRTWLKDPATLKPETKMPDLGLKQTEIEALIDFLLAPAAKEKEASTLPGNNPIKTIK